jgi:choline dehydrogenase-like flavoprotein
VVLEVKTDPEVPPLPPHITFEEAKHLTEALGKQSALTTWLPRALEAGAEIRDLAMVGRVEHDDSGKVAGVHYHRLGRWHFQNARNVVVAGYSIETPRLLLNSSSSRYPDGLANSSGLVGKNLMVQANQAVWGISEREIRSYKGPPSLAISEHWNYTDAGKDFFGGYAYMSQGPLPLVWTGTQSSKRGLWGQRLIDEMERYNHHVGLKIVGECMPQERNRVTLTAERDQYGLLVPRVTYSYCDNDNAHSLAFMRQALDAVGATEIWDESDDSCHLNGTARMGDGPKTSVVNADCRSWDIPNLWICDGSVFPTVGGVKPAHYADILHYGWAWNLPSMRMARAAKRSRLLWDTYWFPGFRPEPTVRGTFGDPKALVIGLERRSKKRCAAVAVASRWAGTTAGGSGAAEESGLRFRDLVVVAFD